MAKINIEINATLQEFSTFADELGYQTEVGKTEEELALLEEPIAIQDRIKPNPQTKQQFLEEYFKRITVAELFRRKALVVDNQVNQAKETEKAVLKTAIESAVGVTSQV
jgi:hypothetical protein